MSLLPPLRICVLTSGYAQSQSPFGEYDPQVDPSRWGPQHHWTHAVLHKATAVRELTALVTQGFDAFVNLCDGAADEDRAGIEVVETLERLGAAFTGADSQTYDPSRRAMKLACHYAGVATPPGKTLRSIVECADLVEQLGLPLLCKHPASYGSIGMTKASKCQTLAELEGEVGRFVAAFGSVLVERFIAGSEWTVLVAEGLQQGDTPLVLPPVRCSFPPGEDFKHFDLKWRDSDGLQWHSADAASPVGQMQAGAAAVFKAIGQVGYGRLDLRLAEDGTPYVLEINPNCGIFYPEESYGSADEILARSALGHVGFLDHILRVALRRRDARLPAVQVVAQHGGYGLVAARALPAGAVLLRGEQALAPLATRALALAGFSAADRAALAAYAYPVGDDVVGTWRAAPEDWRPIDHSCAPTAWLDGLDTVAIRDLAAGESVTLDYATFCGPDMAPFACRCGASACRGWITGWDGLLPELQVRYAGHFSDWWRAVHAGRLQLPARLLAPAVALVDTDPDPDGVHMGLVVRTDPDGSRHAVARRPLLAGAVLGPLLARAESAGPTRHTLQVGPHRHVWLAPTPLEFIDHSCAPNLALDVDGGVVRVLRDIAAGDAATFFYPACEWQMQSPFHCLCGSPACVGLVRGAEALGPADFAVPERANTPIARHIKLLWAMQAGRRP